MGARKRYIQHKLIRLLNKLFLWIKLSLTIKTNKYKLTIRQFILYIWYIFQIQLCLLKQKSLMVGQQCSVSLQHLAHMQQQVKSFLEFSKWSSTHLNLINNFFKNYWKDLTKVLNGLVKNFFCTFWTTIFFKHFYKFWHKQLNVRVIQLSAKNELN